MSFSFDCPRRVAATSKKVGRMRGSEHQKGRIKTRPSPFSARLAAFSLKLRISNQRAQRTSLDDISAQPAPDLTYPQRLLVVAWPRCPLLYLDPTSVTLAGFCSCSFSRRPHTHRTCSSRTPSQRIICCTAASYCAARQQFSPEEFHLPQGFWHTREPPLSFDPDSSIHLALMPSGMSAMVMPRTETMPGYSHYDMDEIHTPSRYFCFFSTVLGGPFLLFLLVKPVMIKACFPTLSNRRPPQ